MYTNSLAAVDVLDPISVHKLSAIHTTMPVDDDEFREQDSPIELLRSASFTHLSEASGESIQPGIKRNFSENVLPIHSDRTSRIPETIQYGKKDLFRKASNKAKKRLSGAKFTSTGENDLEEQQNTNGNSASGNPSNNSNRSVSGSIRSFARKSWIGPAASTSPTRVDSKVKKRNSSPIKRLALSISTSNTDTPTGSSTSNSPSPDESSTDAGEAEITVSEKKDRQSSSLSRPLSLAGLRNKSETSLRRLSRMSSSTSLKSQSSGDKMTMKESPVKVPPLPTSLSSELLSGMHSDSHKRKDPLWNSFRSIEGEFASFQSKTSMQKAKVLRTSLLPFLSKYAQHPSNKSLRVEDLDRRVVILNKWWTGLLEMLNGRHNQSISGTDRPAFLEAVTGIMMRPEWRTPNFSTFTSDTPKGSSLTKSKSSHSLDSDETDFLVDSIHHNVRNIFIQNLLSQMAFIVERLSMRSAPASLVNFSGKACAYAFFFCPGVADILVRLWHISPGTVRRVFVEAGISQGEKLDLLTPGLLYRFPPPVRSLAVSSQAALARHLQNRIQFAPGTERIRWYSPWMGRWSGRDSDLFFVFTKHFHSLVSEFMPGELSMKQKMCIPGLAPVHAQILTVLETTIYRQAGQQGSENSSSPSTNGLENPDSPAPLPMTIANASRSINENRLIMLLRDIVADTDPEHSTLRSLYISSFDSILKAATRKISVYNSDACFVLCDFMEEVFPIMTRYHQHCGDTPAIDWPFWLNVFKQMMESQTTLTRIRLIAFIYSTWSILISNEDRKRDLILNWLLEPNLFRQQFCHWSPMVRHYFYRLLCWRIVRYDGDVSTVDLEILGTVAARLDRCWAHYQYLNAEAEMRDTCLPSSAPCSPAPSRCLLIIRTDSQPFPKVTSPIEKFLSSGVISQDSPYSNLSSALNTVPPADSPTQGNGSNKKRWSLFRNMIPFNSTPGNNRPGEVTPPQSAEENKSISSKADEKMSNQTPITPSSRPPTPPHQAFSFKFSLEFVETRPNQMGKNWKLLRPVLPPNAQQILTLHRAPHERHSNDSKSSSHSLEVKPLKPIGDQLASARYSGRALAEWAQVLAECRSFYFRRKQEGVPRDYLVETPTMGVETFRLLG